MSQARVSCEAVTCLDLAIASILSTSSRFFGKLMWPLAGEGVVKRDRRLLCFAYFSGVKRGDMRLKSPSSKSSGLRILPPSMPATTTSANIKYRR